MLESVTKPLADRRPDPARGVFETMLVADGRPVELDAHLARLAASLAALFPDRSAPGLGAEIEARARSVGRGVVRATVVPAQATLQTKVEAREPPCGALVSPSGTKAPRRAVAARSLVLRGGLGAHKWADRRLLDHAQAALPADALPLIVDRDGAVLEASRANVFAVRAGTLVTPPTDGRILPGITRARAIEIADAAGLQTREVELHRDELLSAEEVFLTGSVRGVERVRALDGAALAPDGEVGAIVATELRRTWAGAQVG